MCVCGLVRGHVFCCWGSYKGRVELHTHGKVFICRMIKSAYECDDVLQWLE